MDQTTIPGIYSPNQSYNQSLPSYLQQQNNPSITGGINNMVRALIAGGKPQGVSNQQYWTPTTTSNPNWGADGVPPSGQPMNIVPSNVGMGWGGALAASPPSGMSGMMGW